MLKKSIILISIVLVLFIILLYWSTSSTEILYSKSKLVNFDNAAQINYKDYDSVWVAFSDMYKADKIKKLFQGEQYRAAWSEKIKVPIVYLDTLKGGMTIIEEGGGKQTHSLKLINKSGVTYTLRSVNKDTRALIPEVLETLNLENIVADGISGQHPLAALLVAEIANKAQVLHTSPQLVFVPKQKQLLDYNEEYGDRLFLLEYETDSKVNYTNENNIIEIIDTEDLQELKQSLKDSIHIDERALIRSRLFDLLIGDWDRHTKQWGWAIKKLDSNYIALPIAGDRDNAFFNIEGIIPTLLSNKTIVKELRPFKEDIDYLEGLVYPFDRYFLIKTSKNLFIEEAERLQDLLDDETLENSLHIWPKQFRDLDGEEIINKIKNRRNKLKDYATEFYAIIQKQGVLSESLKGSKDLELPQGLTNCFECNE